MGQIPKQDTKGELAIYDPKETQNVFEVLQEVWNENGEGAYYTCFVDEYYYEENPVNKGNVRLNEFVNADDRVFTLATSLQYSKDQQSILADAVYSVSQRSIACFYDLDNLRVMCTGWRVLTRRAGCIAVNGSTRIYHYQRILTRTAVEIRWHSVAQTDMVM